MKVLLWNVEWASPNNEKGRRILEIIEDAAPDVICFTETTVTSFPPGGHALFADSDFGYRHNGERRKVALWSREPWTFEDSKGSENLPGGRFVSGVTGGIRFAGVCLPAKDDHVKTGRSDRETWQEHMTYLQELDSLVDGYLKSPEPLCLLGDFNQTIPRRKAPFTAYTALKKILDGKFKCVTEGMRSEGGTPFVDHVAVDPRLGITIKRIIYRVTAEGFELSNRDGILFEIQSV